MRLHDAITIGADAAPFRKFVRRVSRDLLGFTATEDKVVEYARQIVGGSPVSTVICELLKSQVRRERMITYYYERFLNRKPTREGLEYWTGLLESGTRVEAFIVALLGSSEYFARGGALNGNFLQQLCADLFKRKPHATEIDAWLGLLNSHSATREDVIQEFVSSEEFRVCLINEWYRALIGRPAEAATLAEYLERLEHGESLDQVLAHILSGREYFARSLMS